MERGVGPITLCKDPSRGLSLRKATVPAGVQGYTASALGHKGHHCPHTEPRVGDSGVASVSGSYRNKHRDKDPSAQAFDSDPRNHWGRSREVSLGKE